MKNSNQPSNSNLPKWFHKIFSGFLILVLCGIGGLISFIIIANITGTRKVDTPAELAKKKESELNNWFNNYSQYSCEDKVKRELRNPNSYERDGDFIVTDNTGVKKVVSWKFRARNGFDGYNIAAAICVVKKQNTNSITTTIVDG